MFSFCRARFFLNKLFVACLCMKTDKKHSIHGHIERAHLYPKCVWQWQCIHNPVYVNRNETNGQIHQKNVYNTIIIIWFHFYRNQFSNSDARKGKDETSKREIAGIEKRKQTIKINCFHLFPVRLAVVFISQATKCSRLKCYYNSRDNPQSHQMVTSLINDTFFEHFNATFECYHQTSPFFFLYLLRKNLFHFCLKSQ